MLKRQKLSVTSHQKITMKFLILLSPLLFLLSCTSPSSQDASFADSFSMIAAKDTLVFAVEMGEGAEATLPTMDTIAADVFNKIVRDSFRTKIEHILDGGDALITRLGRFVLDADHDALGVNITAFWFRNQSILIFDKKKQQVVGLLPVAEFYGGDGAQILRQSWLLSSNKEIIVRESEHALRMEENAAEPTDSYEEWVARYQWQKGAFVEQPTPDSTALIQHFKIDW